MTPNEQIAAALGGLFKNYQSDAQTLLAQVRDFRLPVEVLRQIDESRALSQAATAGLARQLVESHGAWTAANKSATEQIREAVKQITDVQTRIREALGQDFRKTIEVFKQLPAKTREALLRLAEHGWYIDPDMSMDAVWELSNALADGDIADAEEAFVAYFRTRLDAIASTIAEKSPRRLQIVAMAIDAHKRGDYALAIPALLAQIDGICKDRFDKYLFMQDKTNRKQRRPETAVFVDSIASDLFTASMLSPLAHPLPIGASSSERGDDFAALNRHMVMHGESLDYGTEINSLRALSLLQYVAWVFAGEPPASPTSLPSES